MTRLTTDREDGVLDEDVGERRARDPSGSNRPAGSHRPAGLPPRRRRRRPATRLAQLERARGGDLLARLRARRGSGPRRRAPGRSAPARTWARGLPSVVGRDHEHVVAARPLAQRAHRDGDRRARRARPAPARAPRRPGAGVVLRRRCRARTMALRVVGIDARVDRDDRGRDRRVVVRRRRPRRVSPTRRPAATRCATVKSTCTASSTPCSVVSSVPSFRYWPGCTSAMPTRARNGARIVLRAMTPWCARSAPGRRRARRAPDRPLPRTRPGAGAAARVAPSDGLGEGRLRLLRLQLGLLDRDVERDEHRARLDDLARGEARPVGPCRRARCAA